MIKILLNNLLRKLEVCGDHKPSSLPFCRFSKAISIRWKSLFLNIESVTPTTLFSSSLPPPPAESHVCKLHFQQKASFYYLKRCTAGLSWCTASSLALQAPQKKIREKKTLWKSLSKTTTKQSTKEVLATNHFFAKSAIVFFLTPAAAVCVDERRVFRIHHRHKNFKNDEIASHSLHFFTDLMSM